MDDNSADVEVLHKIVPSLHEQKWSCFYSCVQSNIDIMLADSEFHDFPFWAPCKAPYNKRHLATLDQTTQSGALQGAQNGLVKFATNRRAFTRANKDYLHIMLTVRLWCTKGPPRVFGPTYRRGPFRALLRQWRVQCSCMRTPTPPTSHAVNNITAVGTQTHTHTYTHTHTHTHALLAYKQDIAPRILFHYQRNGRAVVLSPFWERVFFHTESEGYDMSDLG